MLTKEWKDIKAEAIVQAEEQIGKQDLGLLLYASAVRGAESAYAQYGMPGESDTVQGTSTFFVLLVSDLARLMIEGADGKRAGDLSPSVDVMNLYVSDPGGVIPLIPQPERTGLLAFARRTKSTGSTSSAPSTPRGKPIGSGSSTPTSSPMGKGTTTTKVQTRNCVIRKFHVLGPDRAKINILVTIQNLWSYQICQWMMDPEVTRNHVVKKYYEKFQMEHHHPRIFSSFPFPPDSKLTGQELHARLKGADFSQDFYTSAGITVIPLKESNISELKSFYLKKPKSLQLKADHIPAAMYWINADEETGPTQEGSVRLGQAFDYLTQLFDGFIDVTNKNASEKNHFFCYYLM